MNSFVSRIVELLGASAFVFLFMLRMGQAGRGDMLAWLLAFQSAAAAFLLVFHRPARKTASGIQTALAWACAWLPLAFRIESSLWFLSVLGLLLAVWSLAALGRSFSVAPEDRGIVSRGPYLFIRHPMYAGELLACLGLCAGSMTIWNGFILMIFVLLLIVRIQQEENALAGYEDFARIVRWRLLPGVW
jgi:protein-S-isoprenylcysteine O-methyltransferase Ste14